jgi:glycosyltransferase involved in cell wall biosynthesis
LKLLIVGGGSQDKYLKELVKKLEIDRDTVFTGKVPYDEVINYYNMLDIYVAVSTLDSESFGVAVLEASSCEKPVIVSDVGGLPEVVENGVTGFVVPARDSDSTAIAMEKLILDKQLRERFGANGRSRVLKNYLWQDNVRQMQEIYEEMLNKKRK